MFTSEHTPRAVFVRRGHRYTGWRIRNAERARHVDHRSAVTHPRQHIFHAEKHAANIDGHDAIEILFGELDDRTHRRLDARIVDEAVDFFPEFEGSGGVAEHLFRIAHVGA